MRDDYNCRVSSQGIRGLSPTSSPPGPGFLHQDELPKCLVLKTRVAYFLETQGSVGNRDFTFKGHTHNHTHSRTQGRSSGLKGAWVRPHCWPWRASQTGRRQLAAAGFWELLLSGGQWYRQVPVWNPPSSSLAPESGPAYKPVRPSTRTPQPWEPARGRHSPTHQKACCLKTPWTHSDPGNQPCPPGHQHQPHPPVGKHQPHDHLGWSPALSVSKPSYQPWDPPGPWSQRSRDTAPLSSGPALDPGPGFLTSRQTPGPGPPQPHNLPCQDPAHTGRLTPAQRHLGTTQLATPRFNPTHQRVSTRFGTPWNPHRSRVGGWKQPHPPAGWH